MVADSHWTFLSNHGHVLVAIALDPEARVRDLAARVGITERAVQKIVGELVQQGFVVRRKTGRRNCYEIVPETHLRHPLESEVTVGEFTRALVRTKAFS
jgi:DNA-binding MarR family transcriptional regulator